MSPRTLSASLRSRLRRFPGRRGSGCRSCIRLGIGAGNEPRAALEGEVVPEPLQRHEDAERRLRTAVQLNPTAVKANYQLGLLLARLGKKEEADRQLAHAKTLRQEDEASSRLQLRLLDQDR